nr:hypothetical protein [Tanacetum cinerariifolium]
MKDISEMLMRTRIEKSKRDFEKLKTQWLIKDYEKEVMKSKQEAMNLQHKLAIQRKEEMVARAMEAKANQDALGGKWTMGGIIARVADFLRMSLRRQLN